MSHLSRENTIVTIGPRSRVGQPGALTVNTTSKATLDWQSDLSPFKLGPVMLWDGRQALVFENAWQYSKVFPLHLGPDGKPTPAWFSWSQSGFQDPKPQRYPMGKGKKPAGAWWNNQLLGYVDARKQIYFPLYRDAVRKTEGWRRLRDVYDRQVGEHGLDARLQLWDFDAWNHHGVGFTLKQVLNDPNHICGHAFILAMMLLYGEDVTPDSLPD